MIPYHYRWGLGMQSEPLDGHFVHLKKKVEEKKLEKKKKKKKENRFSLTRINEIRTFLHLQAAFRHNKQEKKITDISNVDFFRYSQYGNPIGI